MLPAKAIALNGALMYILLFFLINTAGGFRRSQTYNSFPLWRIQVNPILQLQKTMYLSWKKIYNKNKTNKKIKQNKTYRSNIFCPRKGFQLGFIIIYTLSLVIGNLGSGEGRTEPATRHPEETDTTSYFFMFHSKNFGD